MVEDDRTHAHQRAVLDGGAVDGDVMTYRDIVAYLDGRFLVKRVQHAAVLYVDTVAYAYGVDVAAQYGAEPDAAFVAHYYIAYDGGVVGKETIFAHLRREAAYFLDECHILQGLGLSYV